MRAMLVAVMLVGCGSARTSADAMGNPGCDEFAPTYCEWAIRCGIEDEADRAACEAESAAWCYEGTQGAILETPWFDQWYWTCGCKEQLERADPDDCHVTRVDLCTDPPATECEASRHRYDGGP